MVLEPFHLGTKSHEVLRRFPKLRSYIRSLEEQVEDWKHVNEDKKRLVRELDYAMNGEDAAIRKMTRRIKAAEEAQISPVGGQLKADQARKNRDLADEATQQFKRS